MKDLCFEGPTTAGAVEEACRRLGVGSGDLRFVVLEPGEEATRNSPARPARIAVLERSADEVEALAEGDEGEDSTEDVLEEMLAAMQEEGHWDIEWTLLRDSAGWRVQLTGQDAGAWKEGTLRSALQHVLQSAASMRSEDRILVGDDRAARDGRLREEAAALIAVVRSEGGEQVFRPLNAFERRIVHLMVEQEEGVQSFSRGEGPERRLVLAPAAATPATGDRSNQT